MATREFKVCIKTTIETELVMKVNEDVFHEEYQTDEVLSNEAARNAKIKIHNAILTGYVQELSDYPEGTVMVAHEVLNVSEVE